MSDHRSRPRRRGAALHEAVLAATLAELSEVGYAGLTIDRVAERARTGKATLYRHWPSRLELALDAVASTLPELVTVPDAGSLRADLLALLRRIAALLAGPAGDTLRGLLSDALRDEGRLWELRQRSGGTGRRALAEVVQRAVARGEIDEAAVTPRRLDVGQALLRHHFLFDGPVVDQVVVEVVDEVLVPLFGTRVAGPGTALRPAPAAARPSSAAPPASSAPAPPASAGGPPPRG